MSANHVHINARRWSDVRRTVFDRDGWRCVRCGRAGRLDVDHIWRLEDGGEPYDPENLQPLCSRPCHAAKTAQENGGPGPERLAWREYLADLVQ